MPELMVDFITSLDGYGAAEGWPGFWGLEGPEYLAWLGDQPEADYTVLLGANTYRLMSGLAAEGEPGTDALADLSKIVFSSTLTEPLSWPNTRLVAQDAVEAVREMKEDRHRIDEHDGQSHTLPLASECRSRGSFPRGRLPGHHRKQWPGPDLRRYPDVRLDMGEQPRLRWSAATGRVRALGAGWAARYRQGRRPVMRIGPTCRERSCP